MQSQFTDKARTALQLCRARRQEDEARICGNGAYPAGPPGGGDAARPPGCLPKTARTEQEIRDMIRDLIAPASPVPVKERDGYTPRAVAILEEAHRQAARFGSVLTGTEHILLALIREGENVAVRLLNTCGLQPQKIYADTLAAMGQDPACIRRILGRSRKRRGRPPLWSSTAGI